MEEDWIKIKYRGRKNKIEYLIFKFRLIENDKLMDKKMNKVKKKLMI